MSYAKRLAASALSGALLVLAFEPAGLAWLAPLACAVLFVQWRATPAPGQAALLGWVFGLAYFGAGVSWVYVSLHTFGMMPAPLAALATVLFCAFLALFPAAVGYVQARLRAPPLTALLLAMPGAWVQIEWLRGWIFTGFPWLSLGYSQTQTTLAGFAPVSGVFGVSLAIALCASLLALAWNGVKLHRIAAVLGVAALLALGWGLQNLSWTTPAGAPLKVALAQGNVPQSLKFEPGRYESTLASYRKLVEGSTAPLVILPETAIPRFLHEVDPGYLENLQSLMKARGGDLLLGAPLRGRSGGYYNSVVNVGSSHTQVYSKTHLVPFGEFIPPGFGWILGVLHIPLSDFSSGRATQRPLALLSQTGRNDIRVAVNICYEDAFGEEIARQLPEATLLANVSNVAWFGDSLAPDQHLQISQMRAIETGRYMLRATNSGVTAIIDEHGRVAARLPKFAEGLLEGEARPFNGETPYVRYGDSLALAISLLMCVAAGIVSLAQARRRSGR